MEVVHGGGTPRRVLVVGVAHSLQDHQTQAQTVAEGPLVFRRRSVEADLRIVDAVVEQDNLTTGMLELDSKGLNLDSNTIVRHVEISNVVRRMKKCRMKKTH